jgi:hypothetical protein
MTCGGPGSWRAKPTIIRNPHIPPRSDPLGRPDEHPSLGPHNDRRTSKARVNGISLAAGRASPGLEARDVPPNT